jgi:hypothetical protein
VNVVVLTTKIWFSELEAPESRPFSPIPDHRRVLSLVIRMRFFYNKDEIIPTRSVTAETIKLIFGKVKLQEGRWALAQPIIFTQHHRCNSKLESFALNESEYRTD